MIKQNYKNLLISSIPFSVKGCQVKSCMVEIFQRWKCQDSTQQLQETKCPWFERLSYHKSLSGQYHRVFKTYSRRTQFELHKCQFCKIDWAQTYVKTQVIELFTYWSVWNRKVETWDSSTLDKSTNQSGLYGKW